MAMSRFQSKKDRMEAEVQKRHFVKLNREIVNDHHHRLQQLVYPPDLSIKKANKDRKLKQYTLEIFGKPSEGLSPLNLCNEYCWLHVLRFMNDPRDIKSFSKTCVLFGIILRRERTKRLFAEVICSELEYILFIVYKSVIFHDFQPTINEKLARVMDVLKAHLTTSNVMALRSTCMIWKQVVDKEFQNHHTVVSVCNNMVVDSSTTTAPRFYKSSSMMIAEGGISLIYLFKNRLETYMEPTNLLRRLETNHDSSDNPFISRAINLHLYTVSKVEVDFDEMEGNMPGIRQRDENFWEGLLALLLKFGHHVTYLEVHVTKNYPYGDMRCIKEFLQNGISFLFPNLQHLKMSGFIPFYPTSYMLPQNILPKLLSFHYNFDQEYVTHNVVLENQLYSESRHFCQYPLSSLTNLLLSWKEWSLWDIYFHNWLNLTELYLVDIRSSMQSKFLTDARLPNLLKLGLTPAYHRAFASGYTLAGVFLIVKGLSLNSKLHTLKVREGFLMSQTKTTATVCIHSLKNLEIEHINGQYFLDGTRYNFLVKIPFIENLRLYWVKPDLEQEHWSRFNQGEHEPDPVNDWTDLQKLVNRQLNAYDCSIWSLLPCIQTLTIQDCIYDRFGYNQHQNRMKIKKSSLNNQIE